MSAAAVHACGIALDALAVPARMTSFAGDAVREATSSMQDALLPVLPHLALPQHDATLLLAVALGAVIARRPR